MSPGTAEYLLPDWPAPPHIRSACTLRTGGVSPAPYDSLNLGTPGGDTRERIAENRSRVFQALRLPSEPTWLHQVHGASVVRIDALPAAMPALVRGGDIALPTADAAVTSRPGRVCVVRIADCLPVLFSTMEGSRVAAAHAGWRGLASGVLEATLQALDAPPARILAWLGPAIGPHHFEVGEDVLSAFTADDKGAADAFVPNERGRWLCDLAALARLRLGRAGVGRIFGGNWCTYSDPARFFSYRRDGECGRMAALIWIEPP